MATKNKCLVFLGHNDYMGIEAGMDKHEEGYDVLFVICGKKVGICHSNNCACRSLCSLCSYSNLKKVKELEKI